MLANKTTTATTITTNTTAGSAQQLLAIEASLTRASDNSYSYSYTNSNNHKQQTSDDRSWRNNDNNNKSDINTDNSYAAAAGTNIEISNKCNHKVTVGEKLATTDCLLVPSSAVTKTKTKTETSNGLEWFSDDLKSLRSSTTQQRPPISGKGSMSQKEDEILKQTKRSEKINSNNNSSNRKITMTRSSRENNKLIHKDNNYNNRFCSVEKREEMTTTTRILSSSLLGSQFTALRCVNICSNSKLVNSNPLSFKSLFKSSDTIRSSSKQEHELGYEKRWKQRKKEEEEEKEEAEVELRCDQNQIMSDFRLSDRALDDNEPVLCKVEVGEEEDEDEAVVVNSSDNEECQEIIDYERIIELREEEKKLGINTHRISEREKRRRRRRRRMFNINLSQQFVPILIYTLVTSLIVLIFSQTTLAQQSQSSIQSYWPHRQRQHQQHPQNNHQIVPMSLIAPLVMQQQQQQVEAKENQNQNQNYNQNQITSDRSSLNQHQSLAQPKQTQQQQQQQPKLLDAASQLKGQLMIGQHYNNFSSIIPYSIEQDADYTDTSSSSQEDAIVDNNEPQQQHQQQVLAANANSAGQPSLNARHQAQQQQQQPEQQSATASISSKWRQLQQDYLSHLSLASLASFHNQQPDLEPTNGSKLKSHSRIETLAAAVAGFGVGLDSKLEKTGGENNEAKSRALLPLDSNRLILPQMQQIKSRFNQGCVGGTKCQFFAFCWMSGGSLGASCGLLMTCCVTPSRQEIQPGFYGPVVNDPYCGRSTSKINRIVGGTDASFGQFPWQAFVQVGGSRCGGALISSRHVVTAGHCVARSQHSPSSIKVTLGDYILNSDIESIPHEVFSVVEVLLHPNFRFTPQADRYDVAVLELDRTASYKDNIKPICLPQKDASFVGRVAYVAGWGALQAGSKLRPKVLQHVAVPVIENHVCEGWHRRKGIDIRIYDEMMCAGYELGQRDACQGDSGGPLMLNQFGVWYLVGIVSAGYSCAKQYQPGIYHRVSSSSDWISSNVYQQGANK